MACTPRCSLLRFRKISSSSDVAIVGGGIIGRCAAWLLQRRGHQVSLIEAGDPQSGSEAALGVLMAQVFHRASGRAWRMRQRSLELWNQWIPQLQASGQPVVLRRGLLLLASSADELNRQQQLCGERQALGLPLRMCDRHELKLLQPALPAAALGGLWSEADGQLDPLPLLQALLLQAESLGATTLRDRVIGLRRSSAGDWQLQLSSGASLQASAVVLSAGAGTAALLEHLEPDPALRASQPTPLQPVLGQALELEAPAGSPAWRWQGDWPAAVVWQGINLVPRPDGRLWLGATLEPGTSANPDALGQLAQLNGHAPPWLRDARVIRRWQGLRLRPEGRPAPWLEQLAPGLLLASGHYRNGLLLAPATAEWLAGQLESS